MASNSRDFGKTVFRLPTSFRSWQRGLTYFQLTGWKSLSSIRSRRWQRGKALPIRIYLSAFSDIARDGELIRALVDCDRRERRRAAARTYEASALRSADRASEAATLPNQAHPVDADTEVEVERPLHLEPSTGVVPALTGALEGTKGPSVTPATAEQLSFSLDESHQLQSEAESLRTMLNAVRFTLVRRLGAGGMGVVYEAYDQERGELVALKTMRRVDPIALVRFKQEFRSLSDITHPNLVNLYELFAVEDRWFFTMELVEGGDFVSYVKSRPAPVAFQVGSRDRLEARASAPPAFTAQESESRQARLFVVSRLRDAMSQLAEGIDAIHQAGKLHRDIKPPNVLVTTDRRVVLLDFGLTADLQSLARPQAIDKQIVGTVGHMSPEQSAGKSTTAASDWYSVGVMLYEAMTGHLPFAGSPEEVFTAKQTESPPAPDALVNGLPEDLVQLCVAATRPRSGQETDRPRCGRSSAGKCPRNARSPGGRSLVSPDRALEASPGPGIALRLTGATHDRVDLCFRSHGDRQDHAHSLVPRRAYRKRRRRRALGALL